MVHTRLVAVGSCSIDTILTVPHFPAEDSKLRATSFTRRRGGNTPNSLEVLGQLLQLDHRNDVELNLIAPLPERRSRDVDFIRRSFDHSSSLPDPSAGEDDSTASPYSNVNLDYCLYRGGFTESVSSYIISSAANTSRTIISHNALPEMTFDEFVSVSEKICISPTATSPSSDDDAEQLWFHFEGRIPNVTLQCIRHLRASQSANDKGLLISVELEKPGREGLQELAYVADVIFYSKSWAEGEGYSSAEECLREQSLKLRIHGLDGDSQRLTRRLLICTWGSSGACATPIDWASDTEGYEDSLQVIHSSAYTSPGTLIVDTTGAGDTFIAGVLFGGICKNGLPFLVEDERRGDDWTIKRTLDFANGLAGRKILRDGFLVDDISFG